MPDVRTVRIGDVCTIGKGTTGLAKAIPGDYPLVTTGAQCKTSKGYQFNTKAVCIPLVSSTGHGKKSLNYVHYQEGKFALGSILAAVIPKDEKVLNARYLHAYLQKNKDSVIVPLMRGAANVSLTTKAISNIEIPLPTLKRQEKTLGKIDSISEEHEEFLQEINTQAELLRKLRQSVLQEAIEGKLTAEWRKNNPDLISGENHASKLLERIKAEKEKLVKEGKIKKDKPLPPLRDDEKPFDLPEGWVWCKLGDLIRISSGDGLTAREMVKSGEYPVFGGNGINGYHDKFNVSTPTIVVGRVGAQCGSVHVTPERAWVTDNAFIVFYFRELMNERWLERVLIGLNLRERARESAQPVISGKRVYPIDVALPPSKEQQVIVEQVGKFEAMIKKLEGQVNERKEQLGMLMQAVLREAFAG